MSIAIYMVSFNECLSRLSNTATPSRCRGIGTVHFGHQWLAMRLRNKSTSKPRSENWNTVGDCSQRSNHNFALWIRTRRIVLYQPGKSWGGRSPSRPTSTFRNQTGAHMCDESPHDSSVRYAAGVIGRLVWCGAGAAVGLGAVLWLVDPPTAPLLLASFGGDPGTNNSPIRCRTPDKSAAEDPRGRR